MRLGEEKIDFLFLIMFTHSTQQIIVMILKKIKTYLELDGDANLNKLVRFLRPHT